MNIFRILLLYVCVCKIIITTNPQFIVYVNYNYIFEYTSNKFVIIFFTK